MLLRLSLIGNIHHWDVEDVCGLRCRQQAQNIEPNKVFNTDFAIKPQQNIK